jgi:hypothetical protein
MNFLAILKSIFPTRPTLEQFILAHNPQDTYDVEHLTRQYDRLCESSAFFY